MSKVTLTATELADLAKANGGKLDVTMWVLDAASILAAAEKDERPVVKYPEEVHFTAPETWVQAGRMWIWRPAVGVMNGRVQRLTNATNRNESMPILEAATPGEARRAVSAYLDGVRHGRLEAQDEAHRLVQELASKLS